MFTKEGTAARDAVGRLRELDGLAGQGFVEPAAAQ
jgi:hypothetical protein